MYLNSFQVTTGLFSCAPITEAVANHAEYVTELLGYTVHTSQNVNELSLRFEINDNYVVRIAEGCSSISIIILFLAFILAFSGSLKNTILYGLFGAGLIYLVNVLRIVMIALGIYYYPEYQEVLHDLVFPGIIYGMVFLLWLIWIRKFSFIKKKG